MSAPAGPRDGAWVRMEKSCCGKHREEVSVSWIRAAVTLCSWPSSLCHRETAQAKGSPSPASLLILQNPELLAQLSIPGSCQQHQCPAQRFVELLSAKETPFLPRHFSGQASSQSPATLPRLEKVILECLSLGFFWFFLHSEFCTAPVWDGKAWQLPGAGLLCVPGGGCRGKHPAVPGQCREVNAQPTDCLALAQDAGSRAA